MTQSALGLYVGKQGREKSGMIPGFLTWAPGRIFVPFTGTEKIWRGEGLRGNKELDVGC